MAVVPKVGEKALVAVKEAGELQLSKKAKAPPKKVLDEETYSEDLEKIIARDFFADTAKLRAQKEYMEAMDRNDLVKMRELALKYATTGRTKHNRDTPTPYGKATPATFETPEVGSPQSPPKQSRESSASNPERPPPSRRNEDDEEEEEEDETEPTKKSDSSLTLDNYLSKHTSEDSASFGDIMAVSEEKHCQKHAWLYKAAKEHHEEQEEMMKLKGPEERLAIAAAPGSSVKTWDYQVKNSLMYIPEGVEETVEEKIKTNKQREIVHTNTRFTSDPFGNIQEKTSVAQANQTYKNQGKIGADGKEIIMPESPKVNGYGFAATPSPAPGVNESPMMTWDEIEGTPFRLDGGDTPLLRHSGPGLAFKISNVPKRDRLGLSLVEEVTKKRRSKKQEALKRVAESLVSPSPKIRIGSVDRLQTLSPAAQKLVSKKLSRGGTDKAL